ncbi:hypothetical protein PISMIDRAFT_687642 [Pisolithus microcarpus 441]|uniref:DUF6534 domain-containing protein n=1 Tax=Pisolithus microcarpus 441 TaxID=765257 RepID=A0A0C9YLR0_9AGAM|nr:hypothetical protein PISMIDRAFT_687642 [Pisolithus microcarpus 441]
MADSAVGVGPKWGPGLIGTTIGLALYGVSIFQYLFYVSTFPNDKRLLRSVVFVVFILDTLNTIGLLSFYYRTLISCRWQTTYACTLEMPWDLSTALGTLFLVSFFVQCFYAHRVWIIGSRNVLLTGSVVVTALVQTGFGFRLLGAARSTNNITTLFDTPYAPINGMGSAVCDVIITASVFFYLDRLRPRLLREDNYIRKLNLVFVQMGVITSSCSLTMGILYYQDQPTLQYLTAAPGFMLCKAYSNSMLAVLNARRLVSDQQQNAPASSFQLPTLSRIH